jgi:cephalosporin hydroxylase
MKIDELKDYVLNKTHNNQKGILTYSDNFILQLYNDNQMSSFMGGVPSCLMQSPDADDIIQLYKHKIESPRFTSIHDYFNNNIKYPESYKTQYKFSQGITECLSWKGEPIFKTVYEMALLQMLLWELKPKTIIEIGTGSGASAKYMEDLMKIYNLQTKIVTMDIQNDNKTEGDIEYHQVECHDIGTLPEVNHLPHPWLIIEDCHVNVSNVISHFTKNVIAGDYLIVEDCLMEDNGKSKVDHMKTICNNYPNLMVDSKYNTFFGYSDSSNETLIFKSQ